MDRKKQRIFSVIIGLILAGLVLVIGVRVIQRRASQAAQPASYTVKRISATSCQISAVTETDEPITSRYGEVSPTFFFRFDPSQITPQGDGRYLQEATIEQLGEGRITFVVENYENISTTCDPFSGAASNVDTSATESILPTAAPEPTAADLPTATPTIEPTAAPAATELPLEKAVAFFEATENSEAFIGECVEEFKATYVGLVQVCGAGYQQHTAAN